MIWSEGWQELVGDGKGNVGAVLEAFSGSGGQKGNLDTVRGQEGDAQLTPLLLLLVPLKLPR